MANAGDELLSYGSPPHSFVRGDGEDSGAEALLAFYRKRCEDFQAERQSSLDHLARVEVRIPTLPSLPEPDR